MAAGTRETVYVNNIVSGSDVSAKIESTVGIVAEHVMYWEAEGLHWADGSASKGISG